MENAAFILHRAALVTPAAGILATLDVLVGLCLYGLLRLARISVHRVTLLLGAILIGGSVLLCVVSILHAGPIDSSWSNVLGFVSFLAAIYALSQWLARRWYIAVKGHVLSFLAEPTRAVLIYLRAHHQFLGWIVLLTATGHSVYFLVRLPELGMYRAITGIIDWVILGLLVGGGLLIERRRRARKRNHPVRPLHIFLSVLFLAAFVAHIS